MEVRREIHDTRNLVMPKPVLSDVETPQIDAGPGFAATSGILN